MGFSVKGGGVVGFYEISRKYAANWVSDKLITIVLDKKGLLLLQ